MKSPSRRNRPRKRLPTTSPKQIKIITGHQTTTNTTFKIVTTTRSLSTPTSPTLNSKQDVRLVNTQTSGERARIAKQVAELARGSCGAQLVPDATTLAPWDWPREFAHAENKVSPGAQILRTVAQSIAQLVKATLYVRLANRILPWWRTRLVCALEIGTQELKRASRAVPPNSTILKSLVATIAKITTIVILKTYGNACTVRVESVKISRSVSLANPTRSGTA